MRFEGRTAIVFGGGANPDGWTNGAAAAVSYAREGARVAVVDMSAERSEAAAEIIVREGGAAGAFVANVTNAASVEACVADVIARFGRIDILHNNVGATHMGGPVELSEADFHQSVELNLGSVYRTARAVLPHMVEAGRGTIVNVSSLAALRYTGYPYFAYCATKAAVNQATVALAMQYARTGIRANCVVPGAIDTPLIYKQIAAQYASPAAMIEARNRMVPLGHMGDAFDVARAAVFLASDDARFITGVCLPVDGGQSCATQPLQ